MRKAIVLILLSICYLPVFAQELNASVTVQAPTVSNINRRNLDRLQNVIKDFLNNNKWTNETYLPQERIECNFVITVNAWDGGSAYQAEAQIQSSRPVFGSSYNSTLLNLSDKDFTFNYTEGQSIDFSDQNFISNLSSLLGYYAYTIVGMDKDSFSKLGGTTYFLKAQNTLNIAQTAGNVGWKANDGTRNRYWLNENLLNKSFEPLRSFNYNYHRGIDQLQDNARTAEQLILSSLSDLNDMDRQKFGSYLPNVFFGTKANEIVKVFLSFNPELRLKAYNMLIDIDPANTNKYEALRKR
ncbi:MAG: hypothetical protein JWQ28_1796 [Pedobacter sp.]|jgi:hypothetical protein|nr:hypothetical protein [Pedobacter sp.]